MKLVAQRRKGLLGAAVRGGVMNSRVKSPTSFCVPGPAGCGFLDGSGLGEGAWNIAVNPPNRAIGVPVLTNGNGQAMVTVGSGFTEVTVANIGRAVPSIGLVFLFFAILGAGFSNITLALVLLAIPPILTNTYTGMREVDREVVEDDNWVTSRQPDDLPAFNRAMLALFSRSLAPNRA